MMECDVFMSINVFNLYQANVSMCEVFSKHCRRSVKKKKWRWNFHKQVQRHNNKIVIKNYQDFINLWPQSSRTPPYYTYIHAISLDSLGSWPTITRPRGHSLILLKSHVVLSQRQSWLQAHYNTAKLPPKAAWEHVPPLSQQKP